MQERWALENQAIGLSCKNAKLIYQINDKVLRTCIMVSNNINNSCFSEFLTEDLVLIQFN